jgi:hypothetical protein
MHRNTPCVVLDESWLRACDHFKIRFLRSSCQDLPRLLKVNPYPNQNVLLKNCWLCDESELEVGPESQVLVV